MDWKTRRRRRSYQFTRRTQIVSYTQLFRPRVSSITQFLWLLVVLCCATEMIETKKSTCTNQMELLLFARQAKLAADFEQITSWARHARYADVETAMNQVKAHLRSSYSKRTFFKRERKPGSMINETKRVWFRPHSCSHVHW